jgi:hypothetical protein
MKKPPVVVVYAKINVEVELEPDEATSNVLGRVRACLRGVQLDSRSRMKIVDAEVPLYWNRGT